MVTSGSRLSHYDFALTLMKTLQFGNLINGGAGQIYVWILPSSSARLCYLALVLGGIAHRVFAENKKAR
jgi:hypothetical protein